MSTTLPTASQPVAKRKQKRERLEHSPEAIQLSFQSALSGTPENTGYTLDFFEAIPKFRLTRRRYEEKAQIWETSFRWEDDKNIPVKIIPALIQRDPKSPEMHAVIPGPREEIVWRMLIELAAEQVTTNKVEQGATTHVPFAPVRFTLTGLRERLATRGKSYSISELKETLLVLKRAECDLEHPLAAVLEDYANYISHLHFRGEKLEDGTFADCCLAYLNPLATSAILNLRCWPIDNARVLRLKLPLARWLITRISNRYRQVEEANVLTETGYTLLLSTILRESGMEEEERCRDSLSRVRDALAELKTDGYFNHWKPYTEEVFYQATGSTRQRTITDVKWTFFPSGDFSEHIISGNDVMKKRRKGLAEAQTSIRAGV